MLIFIRDGKYLSHFYKWVDIPDLFPEWCFGMVMRTISKKPPTAFAKVDEKSVIDLDKLELFYIQEEACSTIFNPNRMRIKYHSSTM